MHPTVFKCWDASHLVPKKWCSIWSRSHAVLLALSWNSADDKWFWRSFITFWSVKSRRLHCSSVFCTQEDSEQRSHVEVSNPVLNQDLWPLSCVWCSVSGHTCIFPAVRSQLQHPTVFLPGYSPGRFVQVNTSHVWINCLSAEGMRNSNRDEAPLRKPYQAARQSEAHWTPLHRAGTCRTCKTKRKWYHLRLAINHLSLILFLSKERQDTLFTITEHPANLPHVI